MDGSSARHSLRWKQICAGALSAASLVAGHLVFGQDTPRPSGRRTPAANEALAPILDARSKLKPNAPPPSVAFRPVGQSLPPIIDSKSLPKPTATEATFVPLKSTPSAPIAERKPVATLELAPSSEGTGPAKPSSVSPWMMDIQDAIAETDSAEKKIDAKPLGDKTPKTPARPSPTPFRAETQSSHAAGGNAYPFAQLGAPRPTETNKPDASVASPFGARSPADLRKPSPEASAPVAGVRTPAPQRNPFIKPSMDAALTAAPLRLKPATAAMPESAAEKPQSTLAAPAGKKESTATHPQSGSAALSNPHIDSTNSAYPLPAIDADPSESVATAAPRGPIDSKQSFEKPAGSMPQREAPRTPSLTAPVENHYAIQRSAGDAQRAPGDALPPVVAQDATKTPSPQVLGKSQSIATSTSTRTTVETPARRETPELAEGVARPASRDVENAHHQRLPAATEQMQLTGYENQDQALGERTPSPADVNSTAHTANRHSSPAATPFAGPQPQFTQAEAPRPLPGPQAGPFTMIGESGTVSVMVRRSMLLRTETDIYRTAVVDPAICDVIQFTPREVSIIGKSQGSTHVTFWFDGPNATPVTYLVKVEPDASEVKKEEDKYKLLEDVVNEMFPDSKIQLLLVADKLIVKGQAKDSEEATQIMSIIRTNAGGSAGGAWGPGGWNGGAGGGLSEGVAADVLSDSATGAAARGRYQVINMLRVPGVQQVALRVKIAELNRTAARGFGVDVQGNVAFSDSPEGTDLFFNSILNVAGGGAPALLAQFDGDDISIGIRYLQQQGVIRLLSEPTLVTMSGRPATFVAGGEFAVPTVVGSAGLNAVTTDFRAFGAIISFLPTVVDKDRIRLEVSPEFSQVNQELAVNGTPGLKTRAVTTTVEMREGQTFAIAGLLEDNMNGTTIGDLPFLAQIFGRRSMQRAETELIILVTPELVQPMEAEEVPPLPGFDVTEPDNCQFFLGGKIEGTPTREYRSTVWPRLKNRYKAGGPAMTSGPFGHGQ